MMYIVRMLNGFFRLTSNLFAYNGTGYNFFDFIIVFFAISLFVYVLRVISHG